MNAQNLFFQEFKNDYSIYPVKIAVLLQRIHPEFGLVCYGAMIDRKGEYYYCNFRVWDRYDLLPQSENCIDIEISALSTNYDPLCIIAHFWDMVEEGEGRGMVESDEDYLERIKKPVVFVDGSPQAFGTNKESPEIYQAARTDL